MIPKEYQSVFHTYQHRTQELEVVSTKTDTKNTSLAFSRINLMVRRERCQVSHKKEIVEEFDRGCFVMVFEHGSIRICMVKPRFVELDDILLRIHLSFFMGSMMHLDGFVIEWSTDPRSVFSKFQRLGSRGSTEHFTELHYRPRRVVYVLEIGKFCSNEWKEAQEQGKSAVSLMSYRIRKMTTRRKDSPGGQLDT